MRALFCLTLLALAAPAVAQQSAYGTSVYQGANPLGSDLRAQQDKEAQAATQKTLEEEKTWCLMNPVACKAKRDAKVKTQRAYGAPLY